MILHIFSSFLRTRLFGHVQIAAEKRTRSYQNDGCYLYWFLLDIFAVIFDDYGKITNKSLIKGLNKLKQDESSVKLQIYFNFSGWPSQESSVSSYSFLYHSLGVTNHQSYYLHCYPKALSNGVRYIIDENGPFERKYVWMKENYMFS